MAMDNQISISKFARSLFTQFIVPKEKDVHDSHTVMFKNRLTKRSLY